MSIDFGEKSLYDLILPGTHDTGSYVISFGNSYFECLTPRGACKLLTSLPLRLCLGRPLTDYSRTQHLTIYEQLKAGSRFQDFRVSKLASKRDSRFWLIHGQVASIPLENALDDMNRYHDESAAKTPIVTVVRRLPWKKGQGRFSEKDNEELALLFRRRLHHEIYNGSAGYLRQVPYVELPENVLVGVPGISGEGLENWSWGSDQWIDTYDLDLKVAGNTRQAAEAGRKDGRDNMFVLGWTITPHITHILRSMLPLSGRRIPTLEKQARKMNELFDSFAVMNEEELRNNVNVVFFDFLDKQHADRVFALNATRG